MRLGETGVRRVAEGDLAWPLRRAAQLFGSAEAVVERSRSVTYADLARRVRALGSALEALGVPEGGRVGFLGVNSLAHLECAIGVPASGRILVDLNFRLAESELQFIVGDCAVEVLVVDRQQLDVARRLRATCTSVRALIYDGPVPAPQDCTSYESLIDRIPSPSLAAIDQCAPAGISYTGGTTGAPKGVVLSHENLLANARHNLIATGHRHEDRWLHVCPMFHVAGTANVLACTWVGAAQVVLPRFDARAVLDTIRRQRITHTVLVPTMLGMLLDELEREPVGDALRSLKHIQYAGSPISPALQRRVLDHFDCDVAQFYGMTEAAPTVSQLTPEDHRRGHAGEQPFASRLTGIGAPVVGVEAEVRGLDGSRLAAGEIGELWVRGPNVMLGYWDRRDETESAFAGSWYRSGDAARADTDGYLYLVDRLKDVIVTGGENVYSIEVEAALMEHDAVLEAAVVGIPSARWGEAVHAVVSLAPNHTVGVEELVEHCRSLIAGYKLPRSVELRTEPLPKSGAGKVLKRRLREQYWAGHDRRIG